jgi:hypothetical protein
VLACALLAVLPLILLPIALAIGALLPVEELAPAEVAEVAEVAPAAAPPILRVTVARVRPGLVPLPPVADEATILRAPRGASGRFVAPRSCYAPAPELALPSVL